jgi:hypothetical protein
MNDLTLKAEFTVATTDRVVRAPIRRPVVLGVLLALSMGIGVGYSARSYSAAIEIEVAPPAPRVIVAPPPRAGFVWAPGFWAWNGHEHVWREGRWIPERRGFHWVPDRWEERHGHWRYAEGHWER